MKNEEILAIDTEKTSEEETRLTGIQILNEEITGEGRALRYLGL